MQIMLKLKSFYTQKYPCVTKLLRKYGEEDRLTP